MSMFTNSGNYVDIKQSTFTPTPAAPWTTVTDRFAETLALAYQMKTLLIGADGNSGYLGDLDETLQTFTPPTISVPGVSTSFVKETVGSKPIFDDSTLSDYPILTEYPSPTMADIPTIDLSGLTPGTAPAEVSPDVTWSENALSDDIYSTLLARILADLTAGATGLDATVEAAILARAQQRQQTANQKAYDNLNADIASRGFQLPSGTLLSALTEINAEILRQETDVNNQIIVTSFDTAQKNSQFIIQQAVALEDLIRRTKDNRDKNALEAAKAVAANIITVYAEKVKAFIAKEEAKRNYVAAQAENLKAITESNRARVELFKEQYAALAVRVEAIAKKNDNVVSVFKAEMEGFGEEARAVSALNQASIEEIKANIMAADMDLRAAIASAQNALEGYKTKVELNLMSKSEMSKIAVQALGSSLNAVNASATIGYSSGESKSENWSHGDQLSEHHSYQHDPLS